MKRLLSLAPFVVLAVFPFAAVQACGPDFFPDVFVHDMHPDRPKDYAAGKLGVLLSTYPRADLAVAYRYLIGGRLTAQEQRGYKPTSSIAETISGFDEEDTESAASQPWYVEPRGPADGWLKARGQIAPPIPGIHDVKQYDAIYRAGEILSANYQNCQEDAFRNAMATLESRAKTWGAHSAELADWINGQDAVFSNCGATQPGGFRDNKPVMQASAPEAAPANASDLLRHDRAYQIAAAQFYASQFDAARLSFQSIADDKSSPWRGVAAYLIARTLVREAFLAAKGPDDEMMATFDSAEMQQAQRQLESIRKEHLPGVSEQAVQSLLNLVRLRTEPRARLHELTTALVGPKTDPDYAQDLVDLTWYLDAKLDRMPIRADVGDEAFNVTRPQNEYRALTAEQRRPGFEKAFHDVAGLRSTAPLIDWLITYQSPSDTARKHALDEWRRAGDTPWLTVAIMKASASDPSAPALIEAAAKTSKTSPAWATVTFHRVRLLVDLGRAVEARTVIDAALPSIRALGSDSAVNLYTGLRMRTAASLDEALADAPRKILDRTSEEQASVDECLTVMKNPKRMYDCRDDKSPVQFSDDAAAIFNGEMPLTTLAQVATSNALPPQLRRYVAMMAWVRSVLLKNDEVAAQMLPLLPAKLQQQAGAGTGFHPLMALMRNPGLRPYLDPGVQRAASYDFVESYADNWWCSDWTDQYGYYAEHQSPIEAKSVAFLTPEMRAEGEKEARTLFAQGADESLGSQVIDYARAHPSDPDVPEALFLALRMIRYGCERTEYDASGNQKSDKVGSIARDVGAIMRRRYPANSWTKKAAPFVWPDK